MAIDILTLKQAKNYVDETLQGAGALKGEDGKSAYQVAVDNGFDGTEEEWLDSLKSNGADIEMVEKIVEDALNNVDFGTVDSVNGKTGEVELSASDLNAVEQEAFNIVNVKVLDLEQIVTNLQTETKDNKDNITIVTNKANTNETNISNMYSQITQATDNANTALTKAQNAEYAVSAQQSTVSNLLNQISDIWVAADRHDENISALEVEVATKANNSDVYSKTQVDSIISGSVSSVYKYKGNVNNISDLSTVPNPENGHVYFVNEDSLNYAYMDGTWNPLAGIIDMSGYVTDKEFDEELEKKANVSAIPTKVSDLHNDEEHVSRTDVEAMMSSAGVGAVQTVNGKLGNVVLNASDVGAVSSDELSTRLNSYYNKTEIDVMFGDIEAMLDIINGEVV